MPETGKVLNQLAREQMKLWLMHDIRIDLEVCKLEGLDGLEYLEDLKKEIDGFLERSLK